MDRSLALIFFLLCLTQTAFTRWSEWSPWSPCSRSCDGGVQFSSRDCEDDRCDGDSTRYQLCNTHQYCFDSVDFRQEQCQTFDKVSYRGQLTNWVVHPDPETPCSLTCRSTDGLIVRLAEKVQDGTRCREGALDLCIDGKCMPVGCDLVVGSNTTVDKCGICGGDGRICGAKNGYKWTDKPAGACSVTCGSGFRKIKYLCVDEPTEEEVEEFHCDLTEKPDVLMTSCIEKPCPAKYRWVVDSWSECSATCGGGSRRRLVYCGEEKNNTHVRATQSKCQGQKPRHQEPCSTLECPKWYEGAWSSCSVSCGEGIRVRAVVCRDARGHPSSDCERKTMPAPDEVCNTGLVCPTAFPMVGSSRSPKTRATEGKTPSTNYIRQPSSKDRFRFTKSEEDDEGRSLIGDRRRVESEKTPRKEALISMRNDQAPPYTVNNLSLEKTYSSEPSFMPEEWGPCSATCGEGVRKREAPCKIFLEFSRTLAKLPDRECPGKKPATSEKCFNSPCLMSRSNSDSFANDQSRSPKMSSEEVALKSLIGYKKPAFLSENSAEKYAVGITYVWKISGYSSCSASCLGGVQESIIECVRTSDNQRVSHHLCTLEKRPDSITRTCNDIPCPPRWNISEFSTCNKPCGGGVQTREITCIHEVARGGSNTLPVSADLCPQPSPRTQQFCNMFDCPPSWTSGPWTKCSVQCGGGFKTRPVMCQQIVIPSSLVDSRLAGDNAIEQLGQLVDRPSSMCPDHFPIDSKPCNKKKCSKVKAKINTVSDDFTYVQDPLKKKVTLKIGGRAQVYKGSTINVRCPVKHFDKSRIIWYKGEDILRKAGRIEVVKKGILRINDVTYADNGIYFCRAGGSEANITLAVQMPPRKFGSSEENGLWTLGPGKGGVAIKDSIPSENDAPELSNETRDAEKTKSERKNLKSKGYDLSREQMESSKNYRKQNSLETEETNSLETELKLSGGDRDSSAGLTRAGVEVVSDQEQFFSGFDLVGGELKSQTLRGVMPELSKVKRHKVMSRKILEKELKVKFGKARLDNLKFEWLLTPWSKCSQTCGGGGFQVRAAQCIARYYNSTRSVRNSLCEVAGLTPVPETLQHCGISNCPRWQPGPWTPCEDSKCFSLNTALQKREVPCIVDNSTEVDTILCNELEKPAVKRECYNDVCKGTWQIGDWSEHPGSSSNATTES